MSKKCCGNCKHVYDAGLNVGCRCLNKKSRFYDCAVVSYGSCKKHKYSKLSKNVRFLSNVQQSIDEKHTLQIENEKLEKKEE